MQIQNALQTRQVKAKATVNEKVIVRAKPDTRADRTKDGSRAGDIQWTEFIKVCMRHRWRIHRDDAMHFCRLLKVVGSELA